METRLDGVQIAFVVYLARCKLHFSCKVPGGATDSGQMATVTITVSRCYVIPHQMAHKPMKRCTGRPVAGEFGGRKRQLMNSRYSRSGIAVIVAR